MDGIQKPYAVYSAVESSPKMSIRNSRVEETADQMITWNNLSPSCMMWKECCSSSSVNPYPTRVLSRCIAMVKPRLCFSFCPFSVNLFWRKFSLPVPYLAPTFFDVQLMKAWPLPAVSSAACLLPSLLPLHTNWIIQSASPSLFSPLSCTGSLYLAAQLGRIVLRSVWSRGQGGRECRGA